MTESKKGKCDTSPDRANTDDKLRDASKKAPKKENSEYGRPGIDMLHLPDPKSIEVEDG